MMFSTLFPGVQLFYLWLPCSLARCYHQPLLLTIMALAPKSWRHSLASQADHASRETCLGIRMVMLLCHLWTKLRCMLWVLSQAKRGECLRVFFFNWQAWNWNIWNTQLIWTKTPLDWLVLGLMAHYGNMEPHSQPTSTTRIHISFSLLETPFLFAIYFLRGHKSKLIGSVRAQDRIPKEIQSRSSIESKLSEAWLCPW